MPRPEELNLKLMIFGVIIVVMLLAVSVIIFFISYQKRLLEQQIRLQQVESDYQRQLLASSIGAEEQERARIGHDLHDGIGSSLSTIKLLINQIRWHDEDSRRIVSSVKEIISNTIQDVRNISHNLHPSVLSKFGLTEAVQNLVDIVSEASGIQIYYTADEISGISYVRELALYRIVQELLNNTMKHAGATTLRINLTLQGNTLLLTVEDDGSGFDYAAFKSNASNGTGLKSVEARTTMLQAELLIHSQKTTGTTVNLRMPLTPNR